MASLEIVEDPEAADGYGPEPEDWIADLRRAFFRQLPSAGLTFTPGSAAAVPAVSAGLIFGIYPAAKAARLGPAEALRYELIYQRVSVKLRTRERANVRP